MKLSAKAQASINKVIDRFKSGDLSPVTEIARLQLPADAPASNWSFSNRVMAYCQTGSLDCRGYKQWQRSGRQVQKGQGASFILGPCTIKKTIERDGEEVEQSILVGFKAIPVFAYHQTDGEDAEFDYAPKELPALADVAHRLGVDIRYHPVPGDRLGDCTTDGQQINLGTHKASVFFHELGHAVHARINGKLESGQDSHQETVAEFTACVLAELYGYDDTSGNAWKYISKYNDDPLKAIMKALGEVEKIIEVLETT